MKHKPVTSPSPPLTAAHHDAQDAAAGPAPADSARLHEELAAKKNEHLRLAADFDNFKKRTRRDSARDAAAEKESFILDLLPVLDNLDRALASGHATSAEQLQAGVELTLQQLGLLLNKHGIEAVDDLGQPFDPHRHEAACVRHDPSRPDHCILEVVQHGYCRGEHMFRPAKVIVNDLSHPPGSHHAG